MEGKDVGTLFITSSAKKDMRHKWIAFSATRSGSVIVDAGAYQALLAKKSLLPRGILKIQGNFEAGQVVELETLDGKVFGRGVVHYGSRDLGRIAGKRTEEIPAILGKKTHDEEIHRNDLVIWSER